MANVTRPVSAEPRAGTDSILGHLVRRWWVTALLTVLGAMAGLAYALLSPPVYLANAHVIVVPETDGDIATAVNYAQAYARIATEGQTLDAAANTSRGAISRLELQEHVRASSSPDASVIEITGDASTANRAADLANAVARGLLTTGNQQTSDTKARLAILNEATPPTGPAAPRPPVNVAVGAALGLLLGGLWVLTSTARSAGALYASGSSGDAPVAIARRWTGRAVAPAVDPRSGGDGSEVNDASIDADNHGTVRPDDTSRREYSQRP